MGIAVQLACLAFFKDVLHLHYLVATALAVEIAVLHNFVWHQRVTWKDRPGGSPREAAFRLTRFHLGNGLISLVGNVLLMRLLVGGLHLHYLIANAHRYCACAHLLISRPANGLCFVTQKRGKCGKIGEERAGQHLPVRLF